MLKNNVDNKGLSYSLISQITKVPNPAPNYHWWPISRWNQPVLYAKIGRIEFDIWEIITYIDMVAVASWYASDVFPALLSCKTLKLWQLRHGCVAFGHSLMRHFAYIRSSNYILPYNSICRVKVKELKINYFPALLYCIYIINICNAFLVTLLIIPDW